MIVTLITLLSSEGGKSEHTVFFLKTRVAGNARPE